MNVQKKLNKLSQTPPKLFPIKKIPIVELVSHFLEKLLPSVRSFWHEKSLIYMTLCGTGRLGFTTYKCSNCGIEETKPNSCNNRHCPKCGAGKRAKWAEKVDESLLPTKHFHLVFTLPHELNSTIKSNSEEILKIFTENISATLKIFAASKAGDSKAKLAYMTVLHTWTQTLDLHYHIHILVANGYYLKDEWHSFGDTFLFPVKALSKVFKGKFLKSLENLVNLKKIKEAINQTPKEYIQKLYLPKKWNVYAAAPYKGESVALKYFARYANRVAISDSRITFSDFEKVTFSCRKDKCERDPNNKNTPKKVTMSTLNFLKKFSLHFLPKGFRKINYFGFYSSNHKKDEKKLIVDLLNMENQKTYSKKIKDSLIALPLCKICNGILKVLYVKRISFYQAINSSPNCLDTG